MNVSATHRRRHSCHKRAVEFVYRRRLNRVFDTHFTFSLRKSLPQLRIAYICGHLIGQRQLAFCWLYVVKRHSDLVLLLMWCFQGATVPTIRTVFFLITYGRRRPALFCRTLTSLFDENKLCLCVSYFRLQPKFTKVSTECVTDSCKRKHYETTGSSSSHCIWLILQNVITFYRMPTVRVRYSGRKRTVAPWTVFLYLFCSVDLTVLFLRPLVLICYDIC